jgi:hypothetical protein
MNWESLRRICEQNMAYCDYVAKCVYVYLLEHAQPLAEDDQRFLDDLVRFLEGDSK